MKVRDPKWNFVEVPAHWAPITEFAQSVNAGSLVPAYIEPFLIKVMRQALARLDPVKHAKLRSEIEIFNLQEGQHVKAHVAYNKTLRSQYPGMEAIESEFRAEYEHFLKDKPLKFNVAYSEGFEALGSAGSNFWLGDWGPYLEGADPNVVGMWQWHLAEEFEHRTVAFDVYKALYGNGPFAYAYRVYMFIYTFRHLMKFTNRLYELLLAQDRQGMSPDALRKSIERQKAYKKWRTKVSLRRLLAVFSPFYDPRNVPLSREWEAVLKRYPEQQPRPAVVSSVQP